MNEKYIKEMCKYVVDHSQRHYTEHQKWSIKQAIDASKSFNDLYRVALMCALL